MVKWIAITLLEVFVFGTTYGVFYELTITNGDAWLQENSVWIAVLLGLLCAAATFRSSKLFVESFHQTGEM